MKNNYLIILLIVLFFFSYKGIAQIDGEDCFWKTNEINYLVSKQKLGTWNNMPFILKTNNKERMVITTDGRILVFDSTSYYEPKTPNDSAILAIYGKFIEKELVILPPSDWTGWADYVFDERYNLISLLELEVYIGENKSLPGIPKTKDVIENGMDVLTIQTKLLEKVEELTLYLIELEEEYEKLLAEYEQLSGDGL